MCRWVHGEGSVKFVLSYARHRKWAKANEFEVEEIICSINFLFVNTENGSLCLSLTHTRASSSAPSDLCDITHRWYRVPPPCSDDDADGGGQVDEAANVSTSCSDAPVRGVRLHSAACKKPPWYLSWYVPTAYFKSLSEVVSSSSSFSSVIQGKVCVNLRWLNYWII